MSERQNIRREIVGALTRRSFLRTAGLGLGALALADLSWAAEPAASLGVLGRPHYMPTAKRVIFMHMFGALSQVDSFDYKPTLFEMAGQELPPSVMRGRRLTGMVKGQSAFPILQPLRQFKQYGESGLWVSDLFPYTGQIADDLCLIKSMHTDQVNHDPASKFLHTGFQLSGRPSTGAWLSYALGSDNDNLPGFIVMVVGPRGSS